jgi:membrane fusion protein, multidrug efflux system
MALSFKRLNLTKHLFLLATAMLFISCNNQATDERDVEGIKRQISDYKQQVVELNKKISDLETDLEQLGGVAALRNVVPVDVFPLEPQPFERYVKVNGNVEAVTAANISPETNGQIKHIDAKKGEKVFKGQVVARLNVSVIENTIREVETGINLAKTLYERQKNLWEQKIGSEVQYLQAKNNYESLQSRLKTLESQLEMSIIRAPFDGIVDEVFAKEGELAMPGMPLMQIINLDTLYVNADISESFLSVISTSEEVILRFPAYPDFSTKTKIHRIGHVINPENRTFRLQLRIANQQERFKPNMVAGVSFRSFSTDNALVVPSILIKQDTQGHFLFVARKNGNDVYYARKIYVERGMDSEGNTMILAGPAAGDLIINQGHNQVTEGIPVTLSGNSPAISQR